MASELVVPFVGAIQASISVLLTIIFGVIAAQCNLLSVQAAKEVSRLCVRMLLPALLIYKIGSNMHQDTAVRYVPIFIWSVSYTLLSLGIGHLACRIFKFPTWVKLAVCFNNTTSLPLLLIQSLQSTGILNSIVLEGDTAAAALDRAESYFLINAMISNSLTFALGPRILRPNDKDANNDDNNVSSRPASSSSSEQQQEEEEDDPSTLERGPEALINEQTSLLPHPVIQPTNTLTRRVYTHVQTTLTRLPHNLQATLTILYQFLNAPLIGALVGAVIGLTPTLHILFFNPSTSGGHFNAWLTSPIKNIGSLFATTQIIVVGVKLSQSLRKMKAGEESGVVPASALVFITVVRFLVWPVLGIAVIWGLVTRGGGVLGDDPMLWFAMMLMPTGPPAMILVALTDVVGAGEGERMGIAKLLTISYAITPLICFAVVGSLKAGEAAIGQ